ncbi:MAG: helix-turn-helix domain-containing protein [Desulfobaccales bacterium]
MRAPREHLSKALVKGLRVFKFLASREITEWKSLKEIAAAVALTENETYGALGALVAEGLAEKSAKGFRQSPGGLTYFAIHAQEELRRVARQMGIKA